MSIRCEACKLSITDDYDQQVMKEFRDKYWGKDMPSSPDSTIPLADRVAISCFGNVTLIPLSMVVRNEFVSMRAWVEENAKGNYHASKGCVISGQPGIGKTIFLLYMLLSRLSSAKPVAIQFTSQGYWLFTESGVSNHPSRSYGALRILGDVSEVLFLCDLNDSNVPPPPNDLAPFTVYTSSPNQPGMGKMAENMSFYRVYMDLWDDDELRILARIDNLPISSLVDYAKRWGRAPRRLLSLAKDVNAESKLQTELMEKLSEFFKRGEGDISTLSSLLGTQKSPSILFFVQPCIKDRTQYRVVVPTRYLASELGKAFLTITSERRIALFHTLYTHPATRSAAGWIFEGLVSHAFSKMQQEIEFWWVDKGKQIAASIIPALGRHKIFGRDCLSQLPSNESFYWQPDVANFPTIDAVLYDGTTLHLLQVTVAKTHSMSPNGLKKLHSAIGPQFHNVPWTFVFVGHNEDIVVNLAKTAKMPSGWEHIQIGCCVLELSKYGSWEFPLDLPGLGNYEEQDEHMEDATGV